jgi:hypothetical protein
VYTVWLRALYLLLPVWCEEEGRVCVCFCVCVLLKKGRCKRRLGA